MEKTQYATKLVLNIELSHTGDATKAASDLNALLRKNGIESSIVKAETNFLSASKPASDKFKPMRVTWK